MDLKDIIRTRRTELGLTLEEVARVVGVGKSTVRKWETGYIENMRRDKIAKLAEALQTTPAYLMGWEEPTSPSSPIMISRSPVVDPLLNKLLRLDETDKGKVDAFIDGLLSQDKYNSVSSAG